MQKVIRVLTQKPPIIFLSILIYLLGTGLLKWRFQPPVAALYFLAGGGLGIYFIDFAEAIFNVHPSPFRTILFQAIYVAVCFFVVTSSGSMIASGLVLTIYLSMLLGQVGEFQLQKNLNTWYQVLAVPVTNAQQKYVMFVMFVLFFIITFLFIR